MHPLQNLEEYRAQFDKLNIRYGYVPPDVSCQVTANRVVVYGGGGNLVHPYPNARDFITRHHEGAAKFVVLPHTIRSYPELFEKMSGKVDSFCRDLPSFEFMSGVTTQANAYLAHDVALHTSVDLTFRYSSDNEKQCREMVPSFRRAKRQVRRLSHRLRNMHHPKGLNVFREDVEKTAVAIPFSNVDLSRTLCGLDISQFHARETASVFFEFINRHDVVNTNRLHVCIASLLLNKEVHFFDNSYGKNASVFNFSLKDRFEKLTMHTA